MESYQSRYRDLWTKGDYDNDRENDSAYVTIGHLQKDSGKVFIRFNHLIPSIELPDEFNRVAHLENVNDIDNDGGCEIYLVAIRERSCSATGFLYTMKNRQWKIVREVEQDGCCGFTAMDYVTLLGKNRFKISYREAGNEFSKYYVGTFN